MEHLKKHILLTMLLTIATFKAVGQNIQMHYDIDRKSVTSTIEMFRPDALGSTFFFVDIALCLW